MSDKDRQKKDGQRKDKKNKATREGRNEQEQGASAPDQRMDQPNLKDKQGGQG
ncbi:MAG TPA: hypothetical protein VGB17_16160 [Pyrinomonadaceae bacterium]|jgi:hypothetical protein